MRSPERNIPWLVAACLAVLCCRDRATAQPGRSDAPDGRCVTIPFEGNAEAAFKERLMLATENEPLRRLLEQLGKQKLGLDPELLKSIDLNNPRIRGLVKKWVEKHGQGAQIHPDDVPALVKSLEKWKALSNSIELLPGMKRLPPGRLPHTDEGTEAGSGSLPEDDRVGRWLEQWLDNVDNSRLAELLQDSDAFRRGIADLRQLIDQEKSSSAWGLENLPDHLRFAEGWKLDLGGKGLIDRLTNVSLPSLPKFKLPALKLGRWGVPSAGLPSFGGAGGAKLGEALLWGLVVALAALLMWHIVKRLGPRGKVLDRAAGLGPWPVDPAKVGTRAELVAAFDHLALLTLGLEVRTWNHRAIAREFARSAGKQEAARQLCSLYETARYTAGTEALTAPEQETARRDLCLLAGMTGA